MTTQFNFAVDSFTIKNTRSRHKDTDYISASVAVHGRPAQTLKQKLGDLNNGTYETAMKFVGIPVAANETVVFTYAIINSGHQDPDAVEKALEGTVSTLATKGAQAAATAIGSAAGAALGAAIGTAAVPLIGTALGAVAGWLVSTTGGLLFANCDGPVAAAVHSFTGAQLAQGTSGGHAVSGDDHHPGTDSPHGCGSNSDYSVKWSVHA